MPGHVHEFNIMCAREITAFAAMVNMPFIAAYAEILLAAAAFEKAVFGNIPAAFAERIFFQYRFGAFIFADPPLAPVPVNQKLSRFYIVFHCRFV